MLVIESLIRERLGTIPNVYGGVASISELSADAASGRRSPALFVGSMRHRKVWLRFDGVKTANGNSPVVVDLYRVAINPTKDLSMIGDELQRFELTGRVLADLTKPESGALGRLERMIMLT